MWLYRMSLRHSAGSGADLGVPGAAVGRARARGREARSDGSGEELATRGPAPVAQRGVQEHWGRVVAPEEPGCPPGDTDAQHAGPVHRYACGEAADRTLMGGLQLDAAPRAGSGQAAPRTRMNRGRPGTSGGTYVMHGASVRRSRGPGWPEPADSGRRAVGSSSATRHLSLPTGPRAPPRRISAWAGSASVNLFCQNANLMARTTRPLGRETEG
jgi:hypothetical protein